MENDKRIKDLVVSLAAFEEEQADIKRRLAALEADRSVDTGNKTIEFNLVLPQADIDGLHFNKQQVHAVFEEQEDGWYYSKDILFLSARNTEDDNSRDILTEYLNCTEIRKRISAEFANLCIDIKVALPQKEQGKKKYNGVDWWYWLADPYSGSMAYFCHTNLRGKDYINTASSVGGCAPAFRVVL
jgi:hypothetical protein